CMDRFAVIPSGIDLEQFRRVAGAVGRRPKGVDCPPDALVVGSVEWLTRIKGHRFLIEAIARLKPSHPRLFAMILGGGELKEELLALAVQLGVHDSVRLLGERTDVPDCLRAMDLFVLPSLNEGMGRALVEAMAAARPVIATRVGGIPGCADTSETGVRPLVAALHVHSSVSTGGLSLEQVVEQAEKLGLDAVLLSDNFLLQYEYGIWPLRGVFRRTVALPSVLEHGVGQYLAEIAAVQARHQGVLLIPGIEVAPHYYWTGSIPERNLTMHDAQKNLLVFGLAQPEDYAALPVAGNPSSYRYGWTSALSLTPGLLFVPAAWLWRRHNYRTRLVGVVPYTLADRYRTPALLLAGLAMLLLLHASPLGQPVFSIYESGLG